MREPRWRAEIQAELRAHAQVPTEALILQALGLGIDLCAVMLFLRTSRHWQHSGEHDPESCGECTQILRVRQWLRQQIEALDMELPMVYRDLNYAALRTVLGRRDRQHRRQPWPVRVPAFARRWRVATDHEALVVFLWIARQLLARTHAPGVLAQSWQDMFAFEEQWRRTSMQRAWRAYRAQREEAPD